MNPIGARLRSVAAAALVAVAASALLLAGSASVPATAAAPAAEPAAGQIGTAPTLLPAAVLPADVNDFEFESFTADYHLSLDDAGHVQTRVVETIVALFPPNQNRGIIRAIPDEARGFPLNQHMLSITDENGDAVYWEKFDSTQYDRATETLIPFVEYYLGTDEFVEGRTTYVLEYSLDSTIINFPLAGDPAGVDEFYWDVNGDGWAQTFGSVTARIHLSPELRSALNGDSSCYVGRYGSQDPCELRPTADGFEASAAPVTWLSTVTVAIGFEPGTVVERTRPQDSWVIQVAPKVIFGLLVAALLGVIFILRGIAWRSPRPGLIIAQYDPPEHDVLLSANLIDRPHRGLSALFIDFAVRGIIRIVDRTPGAAGSSNNTRYELQLVDWSDADSQELGMVKKVFGSQSKPGEKVNPGRFDASKGAAVHGFTAAAARRALREGLRVKAGDGVARAIRIAGFIALLGYVPIWIFAFTQRVPDTGPIELFMWLSICLYILVMVLARPPVILTKRGAAERDYLLGIREYLTVAEEDRMRMLQSPQGAQRRIDPTDRDAIVHLYERLLPYAVLWGVEREWTEQLRLRYQEDAPVWLAGAPLQTSFVSSFNSAVLDRVRPIMASSSGGGGSSWSSSGGSSFSSGSSGGGFSGGGGGGGGGGGR